MFRLLVKSVVEAILQPLATVFVAIGCLTAALWPLLFASFVQDDLTNLGLAIVLTCQIFWWLVIACITIYALIDATKDPDRRTLT